MPFEDEIRDLLRSVPLFHRLSGSNAQPGASGWALLRFRISLLCL